MGNCTLKFNNISKDFPGVKALSNVSFSLNEGEVLALIGENGAGKSTLVKCLTGAHSPSAGTIELFGKEYSYLRPEQARNLGVSAVYQEFNLVPGLPVVDNVFMGNLIGKHFLANDKEMLRRCQAIFEDFGVRINPKAPVHNLSPALMQIVEIAKAMAQQCRILILDEPTAPLTMKETEILFRIIRKAQTRGVSVIYISHRLEEIFEICDRVVVLRDGSYVDERLTKDTNRTELVKLMIGRELSSYYPQRRKYGEGEIVLRANHLSGNGCKDISFSLHKGEILGFAGLVGAGRTELLSILFCDVPKSAGEVFVYGKPFIGKHPWHAIKAGLCLLPEDRKGHGLLLSMSVAFNMTLASIRQFCRFGIINRKKEKASISHYCQRLRVKTPSFGQQAQYLSGGNQQKLIVARWLASGCKIILFDEPTRGIDVSAKKEIYDLLNELVEQGCSVVMVSSDFEELIGVADRIAVMAEGELMDIVQKDQFDKEHLLNLASGRR